ncbi:glycoside hydrolase family 16 protein [Limnovirga soli]|uniref:Family 16 glycosylhydrolase n=1 Tax=Limnovirga soli TaxID=2656915 RepID=A0A8J8FKL7_9BACT|nr:glycoside hydrolase family 16 protein [Limnovirga soli]NNV56754.1 family 16 glycosylhydrolase [Limnovirga soli]
MFLKIALLNVIVLSMAITVVGQKPNPYQPDFSSPPKKAGYNLIWHDEFNINGKPDSTNWVYETGFVRNEELQWYQPQNANCVNGVLLIQGKKEKVKNPAYQPGNADWKLNREYANYTSASIQTRTMHQWQFGSIEVRAKIDTALGAWPAIWTLGTKGEWPNNGEVDIMEFYRVQQQPAILANVAWGTATRFKAKWHTEIHPLSRFLANDADWPNKFHVWRMDWSKEAINLYIDDVLLNTTMLSETLNDNGTNPFLQPHYLLLNLAMGGNGGNPSGMQHPITYQVDYVRVYQQEP